MSGDKTANDCKSSLEDTMSEFLSWMAAKGFQLSPKMEIRFVDRLSNYGAFAVSPISAGELLFVVPRSIILSPSTSSISSLLAEHSHSLQSSGGWVPLVLSIMYERLVSPSAWRPYLQVAPNFGDYRLPLLWSSQERQLLLRGTGLVEKVDEELEKMEADWRDVLLPFVKEHTSTFAAPEFQSLEFFKDTVAFILAYSFTEPSEEKDEEEDEDEDEEEEKEGKESERPPLPYMVPMADILNHAASNNAEVQYKADQLEVRATRPIAAGEEIFNTYGQLSNWELLHCYGFALPPEDLFESEVDSAPLDVRPELGEERWAALRRAAVLSVGASTALAFHGRGFVLPDTAALVLSVAAMTEEDFAGRTAQTDDDPNSWILCLEEELEDEEEHLAYLGGMKKLPPTWKNILRTAAERRLRALPDGVIDEDAESAQKASPQQIFASRVCQSQRNLLETLLRTLAS